MSISGAVGDLFAASGAAASADAYSSASKIATSNEALTERSGAIQLQQQDIAVTQAIGGEKAATSGAGFNNAGGSSTDLLRASAQQGALSKQLVANQTEITAQGYAQQAAAYKGQEKAANAQAEGDVAGGILGAVGWIICTELMKQGRMPKRFWAFGSKVFAAYPEAVKEGYYVWAVPSVHHLRSRPQSLYSRFLSRIFNWRAENIAANAGVVGARPLVRGALVTAALWPLCYAVGYARIKLNKITDWSAVYGAR